MTSNIGTALSILTNNNTNKNSISNSISLHGDVYSLINVQNNEHHLSTSAINDVNLSTKSKGKTIIQPTLSLTPEHSSQQISTNDIENSNQQIPKVKMREHSAKKKKGLRDLKSRISLPPELKNSLSFTKQNSSVNNSNNQTSSTSTSFAGIPISNKFKLIQQRSSYYQTNSLSTQTLNHVLNQSNSSLLRLSPSQFNTSINGQLSRNEQRLSMLDLGFGKN